MELMCVSFGGNCNYVIKLSYMSRIYAPEDVCVMIVCRTICFTSCFYLIGNVNYIPIHALNGWAFLVLPPFATIRVLAN